MSLFFNNFKAKSCKFKHHCTLSKETKYKKPCSLLNKYTHKSYTHKDSILLLYFYLSTLWINFRKWLEQWLWVKVKAEKKMVKMNAKKWNGMETHSLARRSTSWGLARGSMRRRRSSTEVKPPLVASSSFLFFKSSISFSSSPPNSMHRSNSSIIRFI